MSRRQSQRHISPSNPVRRRLFPIDPDDAKKENFANALSESFERESRKNSLKWNFDFKNDTPINDPDGAVEWTSDPDGRFELIGHVVSPLTELEIQEVNEQARNETTPRLKDAARSARVPRKRKSESDSVQVAKGIRRKISFD